MQDHTSYSSVRVAGGLLASCGAVSLAGALLFTARNGMAGWPAPSFAYLAWERGLIVAGAVIATLGLAALAALIAQERPAARLPVRLTTATAGVATLLLVVGEVGMLRSGDPPGVPIVAAVLLTFLAQAAFGVIVLRTGLLPAWIGRAAIVWNIGWLVLLPIISPNEIYFPMLHYAIPLLLGIALLRRG